VTHALNNSSFSYRGRDEARLHEVAVVAIVLFGARKLAELGKSLGEGLRGFKDGIKRLTDELGSTKGPLAVAGTTDNPE
jgi:sec-independent protein translocase protein TatA